MSIREFSRECILNPSKDRVLSCWKERKTTISLPGSTHHRLKQHELQEHRQFATMLIIFKNGENIPKKQKMEAMSMFHLHTSNLFF